MAPDAESPAHRSRHRSGGRAALVVGLSLVGVVLASLLLVLLSDLSPGPERIGPRDGRPAPTDTGGEDAAALDALTRAAAADIERFWAETFPALYGRPYEPVAGGFHPYGPVGDLPPCPGVDRYEAIAGNAFYCPDVDVVAWDAPGLLARLRRDFGDTTPALVLAHEVGHAVQRRVGFVGRGVTVEQQADCFAGAWLGWAAAGRSAVVPVGPGELDAALGGLLLLRDAPGVDGDDPAAHGTAFDRIAALQDGVVGGAVACAAYSDESVADRLVGLAFLDWSDLANDGDVPYAEIAPLTVADLERYWSKVFAAAGRRWSPVAAVVPFDPAGRVPRCPGLADPTGGDAYVGTAFHCPTGDVVAWDDTRLGPELYRNGGDFAVATVIATAYSAAVQQRLGPGAARAAATLRGDCLTGTWVRDLLDDQRDAGAMLLSPGDLDEALIALLRVGDPPAAAAPGGGAGDRSGGFARVAAFRDGVTGGLPACATAPAG